MKNSKLPTWVIVLIVIIAIVVLLCSAGLLAPDLEDKKENSLSEEEAERLREMERQGQLLLLKAELQTVESKIDILNIEFEKIKVQENNILFYSRLAVGCIIVGLDFWYYFHYDVKEVISELLKFNSAIVACYSFTAFISKGTPAKFASYLKSKLRQILRFYHRATYNEFDLLSENKAVLIKIISVLESPAKINTLTTLEVGKN